MKKNYLITLITALFFVFTHSVFAAEHQINNTSTPFVKASKPKTAQNANYASYIQIVNMTDFNDVFFASNTGGDPWYSDTVYAHSMYPLASDVWGGNTFIQIIGPGGQLAFNGWVGPFDQVVISSMAGRISAAVKK